MENTTMISIPNYQVLNQIYESSNSLVYRGIKNEDNQAVVLKVLKEDSPAKLANYRQEYEITHSLDLAGVVKTYSLEKYQDTLVIVFEDFGGETLRQWMTDAGQNWKEWLPIFIQVTEILAEIHAENIIHKDINPSNILWSQSSGQIKIIDFGISTVLPRENPSLKNPNKLEGTLPYLSPEQTGRMNRAMDYRSDFYSLGVTFYELLTNRLPFESDDAMELVHCHLAKQATPPHQLNPEIPEILSNIIMKLLEKDADARYQSAWGLKADLEKCQARLAEEEFEPFILGQKDISDKFQLPQKLYGRESDIETLLTTFEKASHGFSEMMLVAGYSGIGKSALIQEIYKPITEKRGYFISGKFDQFQRNIPYSAIVMAFRDLVRQLLTESEAQLTEWKEKILAAVGPNGQVITEVLPEIEAIIGKQAVVANLGPTAAQNRFNLVFQNFIHVFCQPEHPLVIFVDDLQWADSASLNLMTLIMAQSQYMFLIGAYRNNEVDASHPLMITLKDMQKASIEIKTIDLKPLNLSHINQLIADALSATLEETRYLAELVQTKTGGNPFFMGEFLKTLYTEHLLNLNHQQGKWEWDLTQIQAYNITDNVIELMIGKVQKLSDKTQQVLKLAACIGNSFDIDTLAIVLEKEAEETKVDLLEALADGLVLSFENAHKFAHDRVRMAVYSLMPEEQKQAVHWQVGKLLLKNTPAEQQEQGIFSIVDQLNAGIALVKQQSERAELAQLNLIAGKKAKASAAYQHAFNYLKVGLGLLDDNSWQTQYDLVLALHVEAAEAAYLSGQFEYMEELVNVVLQEAKTLLDKIKVYEVKISSYMIQDKMLDAVETALPVLKKLGVYLPQKPNKLHIVQGLLQTKITLFGKRIEDLINLPEMTNSSKLAAMRIMSSATGAAYIIRSELFPLMVFKQVNLSLKYGNTASSADAYGSYGVILCGVLGDIQVGSKFGELALKLLEVFDSKETKTKILYVVNNFIKHWKEHAHKTLKPLQYTYQNGLETGNLEYAAYAVMSHFINSYVTGEKLAVVEQEVMAEYSGEIARVLNEGTAWYFFGMYRQVLINLREKTDEPWRLNGKCYDEQKMLQLFTKSKNGLALAYFYCNKLTLCYLFHAYPQAMESATVGEKYLEGIIGNLLVPIFHFYDSLSRLALFPNAKKPEQRRFLKKVAANQKKMKKWAHHAPMNYLHKFYLVEAELARVLGKDERAIGNYDKAIALAHENEYLNEEALAYELAGKFYLHKGNNRLANHYLREAMNAYSRWGAVAKVTDLETQYPQLKGKTSSTRTTTNSSLTTTATTLMGEGGSSVLDFASVLKASQAIAGEIDLARLLENLMKIVLENAGAQWGCLILESKGQWVIEAEGSDEKVTVLKSHAIDVNKVPTMLINYVARAKESVVLHDAIHDGQFTNDSYFIENKTKSALCMPLLNQGQLLGLLYLENDFTTGAFTSDRLEVLSILSSQAAVSLENALLYRTLEQKVEERTAQLTEANKKVMDSIKYAEIIQSSLLPNEEKVKSYLPDSFFLWMPRDIVGGDIYYTESFDDGFLVAIIDCTGHGVPGAFMTMVVSTSLRQITRSENCHNPADILKRLNFMVKTSLQQDTDYARSDDGLDAAVCWVNRQEKTLLFAGAKQPIFYIKNNKLETIQGDKQSLGYKKSKVDFTFTTHTVKIEDGMSFYLTTDGFIDQLGGEKRFPFGKKRLKKLLMECYQEPIEEQSEKLLEAFKEYKGDNDRQDDVTILGFRV